MSNLDQPVVSTTNESIVFLRNSTIRRGKRKVLSNINCKVARGEFVYLVGKTGVGKSSLLKTIYGELSFEGETGLVCNQSLNSLSERKIPALRRKLGMIFQDFVLLKDRDVRDNLIFSLKVAKNYHRKTADKIVDDTLSMVEMYDYRNSSIHELSGGQKQRVVIARALINNPDLILADEPTGNLDPDTSDEIVELLMKLAHSKNTAVLLATHDYRIINNYPARVIRLHNGMLIDQNEGII